MSHTTATLCADNANGVLFAGREIREQLDEHVAQLYADLDGGLSHLAWLLPGWLPLPSFRSAS